VTRPNEIAPVQMERAMDQVFPMRPAGGPRAWGVAHYEPVAAPVPAGSGAPS
jgi:hypothetical protein